MTFSDIINNENKCVRKVLIEKYSIKSMKKWIVLQKINSVKNLNFEQAAGWRELENNISRELSLDLWNRMIYFKLFEKI